MEAFLNNIVKAIGWSIIHSLWQGAIIYAILFITFLLWPRMTSRLKHNLSFGSLCLTFSIFCYTLFSLFEIPTNGNFKSISISPSDFKDLALFNDTINLKTEAYFPVVVSVYIVGIVFQLIVLLSGYIKIKLLKKVSRINIPENWRIVFDMTIFQLKINKKVNFYLSEKVNVPLVIGFFKPVVLFPISLATQLDPKQVEAILIHELSHIRRNDYLINLVKTFIETILFFNPFVWLTTKLIHIEREHACDDLVVKATGTPLTYAHALLKLELLKDKRTPALSLAATGKNQHLYQRIKRITQMKTNYINVKQQFLILTLAIATVASLAWINPSKKVSHIKRNELKVASLKTSLLEDKKALNHLILQADTDSVANKYGRNKTTQIIITDENGKKRTYTSLKELPDSVRTTIERKIFVGDSIAKFYNSKEWQAEMEKIGLNAREIEKRYNSKEWKDKMAKIEFDSKELEKKFNSPEWKESMKKIEEQSLAIAKKFNSPEWKESMAKIQEQSMAMAKKFESKEWKDEMAKIQKNALEIQKKFDSPEWKQKMDELKKLQDSPEYKELRKKYEEDLEELKKKKGFKTDKAFLLFDSNTEVQKQFLPLTGNIALLTKINTKDNGKFSAIESLSAEKLNKLNFDAVPFKIEKLDKATDLKVKQKDKN
jgi:bla regulator protein BlaR1